MKINVFMFFAVSSIFLSFCGQKITNTDDAFLAIKKDQKTIKSCETNHDKPTCIAAARILKNKGDKKIKQVKYEEAAVDYQQAANLLPDGHKKDKARYINPTLRRLVDQNKLFIFII